MPTDTRTEHPWLLHRPGPTTVAAAGLLLLGLALVTLAGTSAAGMGERPAPLLPFGATIAGLGVLALLVARIAVVGALYAAVTRVRPGSRSALLAAVGAFWCLWAVWQWWLLLLALT